jgi:UDP-glucose 4-epimerase
MSNRGIKNVVIFGGSGFLGSYVADELSDRGYRVIIADQEASKYLRKNEQVFEKCDIMNITDIENLFKKYNIHIIYNFAAVANLDDAIETPFKTININVLGNLNILEIAKKYHIERFVYASSVYAVSRDGSFYGISKYTAEKLVEEYYKKFGLKFTIVRYGSLYGERAFHNNSIYQLLSKAVRDGYLEYKGDGEDLREYIHAKDSAKLSVDIIEGIQYINEHVILTGVEKFKRKDFLTMIREILNNTIEIRQTDDEFKGHYKITPYSFHPTVAKKLTANPFIDLGQGLVETLKEIHKNINQEN